MKKHDEIYTTELTWGVVGVHIFAALAFVNLCLLIARFFDKDVVRYVCMLLFFGLPFTIALVPAASRYRVLIKSLY